MKFLPKFSTSRYWLAGGLLLAAATVEAQTVSGFGRYTFDAVTNTSGTTDPTDPTVAFGGGLNAAEGAGVGFGPFTAVGVSDNSAATGQFRFTGWDIGATDGVDEFSSLQGQINLGKYYEFTITPPAEGTLSIDSLKIPTLRNDQGIRTFAVRASLDNYAANLPASMGPDDNGILSVRPGNIFFHNADGVFQTGQGARILLTDQADFQNRIEPVTFRFYAWNAETPVIDPNTGQLKAPGNFGVDNVRVGVTVSPVSSLKRSASALAGVSLYPNPAAGTVFLALDQALVHDVTTVRVQNLTGQCLRTLQVRGSSALSLAGLPTGLYLVEVAQAGRRTVKKLHVTQ